MAYIQQNQPIPKRHLPTGEYNGLTLVLSNPSRFDSRYLLSANGGQNVQDHLKGLDKRQCDIRLWTEQQPLLPDTKCVLLFGEVAMHGWCPSARTNTINEQRGSLLRLIDGTPAIATYNPQEAVDVQDYEKQKNQYAQQISEWRKREEEKSDKDDKRRHGATSPKNWNFWLQKDCEKASRIVQGVHDFWRQERPKYRIWPSAEEVIYCLSNRKNSDFFFDIETDEDNNILCLAFSFSVNEPIYVVPFLDHEYNRAYTRLPHIYRALGVALRQNVAVAHNGSGFDFIQLARKYQLAIGPRVYDTMLAQHRCFPKVEKSLGHCVSLWTYEEYHKDEADFSYHSKAAADRLYSYCGKDVYSMMLVKQAIDGYAKKVPGLVDSIEQVNSAVKPYVTAMLQGVSIDLDAIADRTESRIKEAEQYMRVINVLTGPNILPLISNQKCVHYFHDCLGYDVQGWTQGGNEAMDRKSLLKLKLWAQREFGKDKINPVIDLVIKYREAAKEASMLGFNHYLPNGDEDPRTTSAIQLSGAYTFRLSSRKFAQSGHRDDKVGGNLQNWEADTRVCCVADDGKVFVSVDQSGAEALIVAYLCRAGRYRELFESGVKCHSFVALHAFPQAWMKLFGAKIIAKALACSPRELSEQDFWPQLSKAIKNSDDNKPKERYYYIGKMIGHSSNYGAKWPTFQINVLDKSRGEIVFTAAESKEFLLLYHRLFPEIIEWQERVRYQVIHTGYIFNLFGYPCHFAENKTIQFEKDWFAFGPQSTVGTITNIAATKFYQYAETHGKDWDLLINTHDGLLTQCPEAESKECARVLVDCITPKFKSPFDGTEFQMKAEVKVGYNWANRKEDKDGTIVNERGLQEIKL